MLVWCSRPAARASRRNRARSAGSPEQLQRDVAVERLLEGLVDDAHAAAADLADDAEVVQPLRRGSEGRRHHRGRVLSDLRDRAGRLGQPAPQLEHDRVRLALESRQGKGAGRAGLEVPGQRVELDLGEVAPAERQEDFRSRTSLVVHRPPPGSPGRESLRLGSESGI